ncbi:disulfide bond formation protein DsbA [Nocardia spumae]|uniref:mycothiol-dependent nitroreductase Rv2466c family protein n=1 Tax=Nocardia spumae TaxID=2887190 RepID=UPI001D143C6F|nr:disulfide bond formation protein DsbA [Nocardia spumae]
MAEIELYVDPVCPFGWVTARWLLTASDSADADTVLRQMSLAALNEGHEVDTEHRPMIDRSRRVGRLFAAVSERYGIEGFGRLYPAFGIATHGRGETMTARGLSTLLAGVDLDPALAEAVGDPAWDEAVTEAHRASQRALGERGGCPIISIGGRGFFGPVLTEIPGPRQGARLLEALVTAASTPGFAELRRPYSGPPRTVSPGD